ncbi:chromate efflux transporter [Pelagibacterium montanilacus]|uniref:chromate efflux transporter n=1 Tax=Pelagibacterium montanilacus TaxID=2185280 RepID=UPI000F8F75DC|nr:chromate efflux transporter [Pelagibacterium montanilacus]
MQQGVEGNRTPEARGTPLEVFVAFLMLGLTSFGGPIAHLGYFRTEFVERRKWLDDRSYADLVALCQFLPGPASSQVGFAIGLSRAGPLGALAAWTAFTLPSAILLVAFAYGAAAFAGPVGSGIVTGLKIVAVAIVAQAVWGMAQALCPDRERAGIALGAVILAVFVAGSLGQVSAIALGGLAGLLLCRPDPGTARPSEAQPLHIPVSRSAGIGLLAAFALLLLALPLLAGTAQPIAIFDAFYRAGALVFGGGHVVLPLLEAEVVQGGRVAADQFLAGYGAAQAVPGPLFTFAAYLGAILDPGPNGIAGAAISLVAIFLPGLLLLVGIMPFWDQLRTRPAIQAVMRGANAAVVGILGAALYDPVFTSAIIDGPSFALALVCFILLVRFRAPPWAIVIAGAIGGVALSLL